MSEIPFEEFKGLVALTGGVVEAALGVKAETRVEMLCDLCKVVYDTTRKNLAKSESAIVAATSLVLAGKLHNTSLETLDYIRDVIRVSMYMSLGINIVAKTVIPDVEVINNLHGSKLAEEPLSKEEVERQLTEVFKKIVN
jgi:hypothetical protein